MKLFKHVYRLCNFTNPQMPHKYMKQNIGNKNDVFLEVNSVTNVSSLRIYIGTTMGYPTQFSMQGKLNKLDLEYHNSVLHDEIIFD